MYFTPKNILKTDKKFYTIDIETYSLAATPSNLWFGCIFGDNYKAVFYSQDQFLKIIAGDRFRNSIIFAHNGGGFDYLVLFGNLLEKGAIYVGSRFIFMEYKKVIFADSMNFFKTSVEKLGELIGRRKTDLQNKGNIQRDQKPTADDIEYCYNDCAIIYDALKAIFEGNRPCLTVGSLSLQIFQRFYLKDKIKFDPDHQREFIGCYYGGRTEAFQLGAVNCEVYDINSMYPYAMKNVQMPHPSYTFIKTDVPVKKAIRYINDKEGMITGTVRIPKGLKFMPLPYMDKKLIFPSGEITGSWCINELRYALKLGCELVKCDKLVGSSRILYGKDFFGGFIDTHYALKEKSKGIQREFQKMVLNNLYGKFGQHNFEEVVYFQDIKDAQQYILKQKCYWEYEIRHFNKLRKDCTVNRTIDQLTKHSLISIAAYITAYSRILLHEYLMKYDPIYCDTDSLFIPVDHPVKPDTSEKLGDLKKEEYIVTHIAGCKSYTKVKAGKEEKKIKGIPKKAKKIGSNKYEFNNIMKPKAALRRNQEIGSLTSVQKKVSNEYTKGHITFNKIKPFVIQEGTIMNPNFEKKIKKLSLKARIASENPESFRHLILKYLYFDGKIGKKEFREIKGHLDINKAFLIPEYSWESLYGKLQDFDTESFLYKYESDLIKFGDDICEIAQEFKNKTEIYKELKKIYLNLSELKFIPDEIEIDYLKIPF